MRTEPGTRAYVERRLVAGRTNKEIRRCLKRYTSRPIFRTLMAAHRTPEVAMQLLDTSIEASRDVSEERACCDAFQRLRRLR